MYSSNRIAPNEFFARFKVSIDLGENPIDNQAIIKHHCGHQSPEDQDALDKSDERIDFFGYQIFKVLGAFVKDGQYNKRIDRALEAQHLKNKVSLTHLTTDISAGHSNPDGSQHVLHSHFVGKLVKEKSLEQRALVLDRLILDGRGFESRIREHLMALGPSSNNEMTIVEARQDSNLEAQAKR
ncbi:hypothetical protein PspLS_09449 [Pyricularia sp. CBS 133598]|nr:hypothetical protein PspLS_09449 [Pyricularia sp. CBS 133598]